MVEEAEAQWELNVHAHSSKDIGVKLRPTPRCDTSAMRLLVATAVATFVAFRASSTAHASYCNGGPKPGAKPNLYPITEPKVVHVSDYFYTKSVDGGGRLFHAIHSIGNTTFPVLHLYGSGYDMGFAQGMLLKEKLLKMWNMFFEYVVNNTPGGMKTVEKILRSLQQDSRAFIPKR